MNATLSARATRTGLATAVIAALSLGGLGMGTADAKPAEGSFRLVVDYHDGVDPMDARGLATTVGASRSRSIEALGAEVLDVPAGRAAAALSRLSASSLVASVDVDAVATADSTTPNDPYWSQQWGYQKIQAPEAWGTTIGNSSVIVAVLDSGVDSSHPDLQGALLPGYNAMTGTSVTTDDNGHGTQVAGLVAGRGNNNVGVAGACWDCTILPVKVMGADLTASQADIAAGIVWATDNGADVINLSLSSAFGTDVLAQAVRYALDRNVVVVASAGNEGTEAHRYPAAFDGVVSVAGSDKNDARYLWSSYGSWVDAAGPGCNVTTRVGGSYGTFCGTSSAAPAVAGVVGLMRSMNPSMAPTEVESALRGTSVAIGAWVASGRIDAASAVAASGGIADPVEEPVEAPVDESAVSDSDVAIAVPVNETWSGRLSKKDPTMRFSITAAGGPLSTELTSKGRSTLTVTVIDALGAVVRPDALGHYTVPSGTVELVVAGSGHFALSATYTVS